MHTEVEQFKYKFQELLVLHFKALCPHALFSISFHLKLNKKCIPNVKLLSLFPNIIFKIYMKIRCLYYAFIVTGVSETVLYKGV